MRSTIGIEIGAPPHLVYAVASDVTRWERLLPHYSRSRVERRHRDGSTTLRFVARRPVIGVLGMGLPVAWRSRVSVDPARRRLRFRHTGGVTAGMAVEWRFEPTDDGVRVSILHDLDLRWPLIGRLVGERVIGPVFVANIAGKTLARIKALAEAATLAGPAGTDRARGDHADARSNPT